MQLFDAGRYGTLGAMPSAPCVFNFLHPNPKVNFDVKNLG
jgi:hypothetical protein